MLINKLNCNKGRTFRQRKLKSLDTRSCNASSEPKLIKLMKWMKNNNWVHASHLQPAFFIQIGRGMIAKKYIKDNELLISIPKNLLITTNTVMTSNIGHMFQGCNNCLFPTCQQILSTYLAFQKGMGSKSAWSEYISTIPSSFSTPFYCFDNEILPAYILSKFENMKKEARDSYAIVRLQSKLHSLQEISWDDFLWAWCAVNSRAVYFKPDTKCQVIKDKDCLALAPYLDLLNHSPHVAPNHVEVRDGQYQLRSSSCFKAYEQVFISYGPHDNLTLCLEYGFIVPGNPHDFVSISKEEICKHIGVKYSAPNTNFMCTTEGLSWDGKCQIAACLRISKNDIYSNEEIICAEKKIIKTKISFLNQELSLVNVTDVSSESYSVIKLLLEEHIQILKSALV